ncbi:translation initiation factor IF-2-like [Vidua chalybeata]|uniref:translation initiation factor IF-2-like n=1 Tax=Vidua chalybeata TaxID=81927 RepID=UPI0023A8F898|nr:translation initiation factor IF-2-like [Vidua chalybeata]
MCREQAEIWPLHVADLSLSPYRSHRLHQNRSSPNPSTPAQPPSPAGAPRPGTRAGRRVGPSPVPAAPGTPRPPPPTDLRRLGRCAEPHNIRARRTPADRCRGDPVPRRQTLPASGWVTPGAPRGPHGPPSPLRERPSPSGTQELIPRVGLRCGEGAAGGVLAPLRVQPLVPASSPALLSEKEELLIENLLIPAFGTTGEGRGGSCSYFPRCEEVGYAVRLVPRFVFSGQQLGSHFEMFIKDMKSLVKVFPHPVVLSFFSFSFFFSLSQKY